MEMLADVLSRALGTDTRSSQPFDRIQYELESAEFSNSRPGNLTGYDCPLCLNRGYFDRVDEHGHTFSEPCSCMEIRRSLRRMAKSGLGDMLTRYTLDNWQTVESWQEGAADAVRRYAEQKRGWFVMAGTVGAGKTHLCTALCGLLLADGLPVRYILWRDFSVQAKSVVNDDEAYSRLVEPLKRVKVLYIDDLFKVGKGGQPTAGDVNLAFELLNSRYNNTSLLTIISTERTLEEILAVDEAVGSRIYERSKGSYLSLAGKKNWRLRA